MTVLASEEQRYLEGATNFERALIWSFLNMKQAVAGRALIRASAGVTAKPAIPRNAIYDKLFKINPVYKPGLTNGETVNCYVELECKLPYEPSTSKELAGFLPVAIKDITKATPDAISQNIPSDNAGFIPIPTLPTQINTLEKYLAWVATAMQGATIDPKYSESFSCLVWCDELGTSPHIGVSAKLPIRWQDYVNGRGLLLAAVPTVTATMAESPSGGDYNAAA